MALKDVITKIYETKWDYVNDFKLTVSFPAGYFYIDETYTKLKEVDFDEDSADEVDKLNLAIKTFTIPDLVTQPIETFVGGQWSYTTGIKELKRIDVTFNDFDDFYLYRLMTYILDGTKDMFPEDQYWGLKITPYDSDVVIFETEVAILDSVSNISLDRTNESQIAEFSISFKTR